MRDAIGGDVKLLVDANGAYTVAESIALAKDLLRLGVYWLEEPVHPEYPDDLARIRRRVDLPVVSGEWLGSWFQFRDLAQSRSRRCHHAQYHALRRHHGPASKSLTWPRWRM